MSQSPKILYTLTDEAPALATRSLLPIIQAFTAPAGIDVETRNISLASRILAVFPERLTDEQRVSDDLAELGRLAKTPQANIIKLPNISASIPQLTSAIKELQSHGFDLPDYPEEPQNEEEKAIQARYDKVKGSAVNPVLREGNSDRRAPRPVKEFARTNPHRMGEWSPNSASHVSTMQAGDFFHNEQSVTVDKATTVRIEFVDAQGQTKLLKELDLLDQEIIDATVMSKKALITFLTEQIDDARDKDILFSLHMKATMMKVSDPIIFGHAVEAYFHDLLQKHAATFDALGVDFRNGFGDLIAKLQDLPQDKRAEVQADINAAFQKGPALAMVNSDKGITNLHVPSDVIIDASMPAMIRTSGQMWNAEGNTQDVKAVIPDSTYAPIYQEVIDFCKEHGAFDPATMGSVPNVGLMAQKAEEYGSHDKTFEISSKGEVRVVDASGNLLMRHDVEAGDIWRMCQTKDEPVRDWVKLAIHRARVSSTPAVFWLDSERAHDARLIEKVEVYLGEEDTTGLDIHIMSPLEAMRFSLIRIKDGKDTISVTGNVLRDYLTDLFPILELGTSAKMLSIVPLMAGGGLFETGAGGSAPKHVQQFQQVNYLRWDSLGEFLALAESLNHVAESFELPSARVLATTLNEANTHYLLNNKSPARKIGQIDNRGSHFYLALYWAKALAAQDDDRRLKKLFTDVANSLQNAEEKIVAELIAVQNQPVDLRGYYDFDESVVRKNMRPSATFNAVIARLTENGRAKTTPATV